MSSQLIPIRVLVVDDDLMSRELLVSLFESKGYAVESAESGPDALARLQQSIIAPDLVLTDMQMPGLSGAPLAAELRRLCPATTLLLATSGSHPPQQAVAAFDGFLLKPFRMSQITEALAAHKASRKTNSPPVQPEKWAVVRGPASEFNLNSKLVSISESPAQSPASKKDVPTLLNAPSAQGEFNKEMCAIPILSERIYQQLASSMPPHRLRAMYSMCLSDARKRILSMRKLAELNDSIQFAHQAHAIKGGCGMLGATELQSLAAKLEISGLAPKIAQDVTSDTQDVNCLDELSAACDRLESILGIGV